VAGAFLAELVPSENRSFYNPILMHFFLAMTLLNNKG
jgi:hypothetical protein